MILRKPTMEQLAQALSGYTNKKSQVYDPLFDKEVRKTRVDWFRNTMAKNKKILLKMARNGELRPSKRTHKLGNVLGFYTNKKSRNYDPVFDKEIRVLAQYWFINTTVEKKRKLLEMAKNGKPKPSPKTRIGQALRSYTWKKHRSYDKDFDKEIKTLKTDWFINTAVENKKKLLEMAKNGEPKPPKKSKIGKILRNYINKSSWGYDAIFVEKLKVLNPDWVIFIDTAEEKIKQLLQMAKNGEAKPPRRSQLGHALYRYTTRKTRGYRVDFDKEIRALRTDWFSK